MLDNRVIGHSHTDARNYIYQRRSYGCVRRSQVLHRQVVVDLPYHPQVARRHINVDEHRQAQGYDLKHNRWVSTLMWVRVRVNVCVCVNAVCVCVCMCVCMCACVYVLFVCVCMWVCVCTCVRAHIHVCMCSWSVLVFVPVLFNYFGFNSRNIVLVKQRQNKLISATVSYIRKVNKVPNSVK